LREIEFTNDRPNLQSASFRACLASILELALGEVPQPVKVDDPGDDPIVARWLAGLSLGLVPIVAPDTFDWGGPWLARVRPPDVEPRFVVMFGHPSGVVWDPAHAGPIEHEWIDAGYLVAAADIALARPAPSPPPLRAGVVEAIAVAPAAGEPAYSLDAARALAGHGLEGDRHVIGAGTFPSGLPGSALTLIEAEVCESFDPALSLDDHRRNLVTRGIDLNGLVGHEFTIGAVRCRCMRLCEPCTVIDRYADRPILRPLVHRGGVRADILTDGVIHLGDRIELLASTADVPEQQPHTGKRVGGP
jgi:MOSC domain-containing protein YiiM